MAGYETVSIIIYGESWPMTVALDEICREQAVDVADVDVIRVLTPYSLLCEIIRHRDCVVVLNIRPHERVWLLYELLSSGCPVRIFIVHERLLLSDLAVASFFRGITLSEYQLFPSDFVVFLMDMIKLRRKCACHTVQRLPSRTGLITEINSWLLCYLSTCGFTGREMQVISMLSRGLLLDDICCLMKISRKTLYTHRRNICTRMRILDAPHRYSLLERSIKIKDSWAE